MYACFLCVYVTHVSVRVRIFVQGDTCLQVYFDQGAELYPCVDGANQQFTWNPDGKLHQVVNENNQCFTSHGLVAHHADNDDDVSVSPD